MAIKTYNYLSGTNKAHRVIRLKDLLMVAGYSEAVAEAAMSFRAGTGDAEEADKYDNAKLNKDMIVSLERIAMVKKDKREPDARSAPVAGKATPAMSAKQEQAADAWWNKVLAGRLTMESLRVRLGSLPGGAPILARIEALWQEHEAENVPMPDDEDADVPMPEEDEDAASPLAKAKPPGKPSSVAPVDDTTARMDKLETALANLTSMLGAMAAPKAGRKGKAEAA